MKENSQSLLILKTELKAAPDSVSAISSLLSFLGEELKLGRCIFLSDSPDRLSSFEWSEQQSKEDFNPAKGKNNSNSEDLALSKILKILAASLTPSQEMLTISDSRQCDFLIDYSAQLFQLRANNFAVFRLRGLGQLFLVDNRDFRNWSKLEILLINNSIQLFWDYFSETTEPKESAEFSPSRSSQFEGDFGLRLVENSKAAFFIISQEGHFIWASSFAVRFFGIDSRYSDLHNKHYLKLESNLLHQIHETDKALLKSAFSLLSLNQAESIEEEVRVVDPGSGRMRWILIVLRRADFRQEKLSLECFAIDITRRKEAQLALELQTKKVEALYTVASAISGHLDPVTVAFRGLTALCTATNASAGVCFAKNTDGTLELVAHHGFSKTFAEKLEDFSDLPGLSGYVSKNGQAVVVDNLETDHRSSRLLNVHEDLKSAVVVPILVEDVTVGALGLFSRRPSHFEGEDVLLVSAAAHQIGLARRQANLFDANRSQTRQLSSLYRMSRELTGNLDFEEIFSVSFEIIKEELGFNRQWIGLLNETATRIIGQAASGSGWRKRLVEVNIILSGDNNPITQVIKGRKPILLEDATETLKKYGLERVISKLEISSLVLIPLISSNQVIGVLAAQPSVGNKHPLTSDEAISEDRINLLNRLGRELASAIIARRFEDRNSEREKMRTVGLLASGIAHNFNNLLQAIMGQASLLQIQTESENINGLDREKVVGAAELINQAANKGATLVRKLMSFTQDDEPSPQVCNINEIISNNLAILKTLLSEKQKLLFHPDSNLPKVMVDPEQLIKMLTELVRNAAAAIANTGSIEIFTNSLVVQTDDIHPEVLPGFYVRLGVRDDGPGLSNEVRKRCFEPFFTTNDVDKSSGLAMNGSGLGLAAAYSLAKKNGGQLIAEGRPGNGSVFTVFVPAVEALAKSLEVNTGLVKESKPERKKRGEVSRFIGGADVES